MLFFSYFSSCFSRMLLKQSLDAIIDFCAVLMILDLLMLSNVNVLTMFSGQSFPLLAMTVW